MTTPKENKKRERKAMAISLVIHGLFALLFFFLLAWREPNPPIPEYGIELNFGMETVGSGNIQQETPPQEEQVEEPTRLEEIEEELEETTTEAEELVEEIQEVETAPIEEPATETESPDVVVPEEQPEKEPTPVEKPVETAPKPEKELPVAELESKKSTNEGKVSDQAIMTDGSEGDDKDEKGDKGDPKGSVDSRALYGTAGGGGGASLELSGWNWDYLPKPKDESVESGRIVFEISVDDSGFVIGIKTIERTVSAAVEKIYRDEVSQLTFSPTSGNSPAPVSTGRITFIIRNN